MKFLETSKGPCPKCARVVAIVTREKESGLFVAYHLAGVLGNGHLAAATGGFCKGSLAQVVEPAR